MKKDGKLHTVTKWNRPAFMSDENLFAIGGDFFQHQGVNATGNGGGVGLPPVNWSDPMQRRIATSMTKGIVDTFTLGNNNAAASFGSTGLGLANSPKDKSAVLSNDPNMLLTSTPAKSGGSNGLFGKDTWKSGGAGWAALGAASNALDAVPTGERRGLWDTLDPVHHLAGGRESGVGNTLGDTGVALTKAGISSGKPWLALAGAGLKVVGGLTNAAFGIKTDKEAFERANQSINANKNFVSKAESFDDIKGPASMTSTNVYQGGWFSGGKADRKNQELAQQMQDAYNWADRSIVNNIDNLAADQLNDSLRNYAAFGGPLEQMAMDNNGIGAIGYGLMSDYIASRNRQVENKNKMTGLTAGTGINTFGLGGCVPNVFCGGGRYFDFGGNMQTNSADYPTGLTHIDAGQSHEQNPNGGVQMGTDSEGTPNLVEEGETVFNDYVFSDRINIDDTAKEKFHIGKKQEMTYAKLSKKLENEVAEHPNDPIAQRGFQAQMQQLQEQQERQKQEMEAEKAQEAFASLPPEEQTAMMQQRAAQEQQAQQAAMEQQAMAEQQVSPEEQMVAQQMQADGSQANLGQEPQMNAEGGKLYKKGGYLWDEFFKKTNKYSKQKGNNANRYQIDKDYDGNIAELQDSKEYKDFTNYILNKATDDERKRYFEWIDANTGRNNKYLVDGELRPDWRENFEGARTDGLYGIQHYVPDYDPDLEVEATANDIKQAAQPRIFHALEGDEDYIQGELDPNVVGAETRRVTLPNGDIVIYHGQPTAGTGTAGTGNSDDKDENVAPVLRDEWPRYVGLAGPAVGLGLWAAGVGKPDYSALDAAVNAASQPAHLASYQTLGNYLAYRPLDIWYEQNRMDANSRATDRNIMNTSGGNRGTAMAGLLTNGYNTQIADGALFRQAQEYNDKLRQQVAEFNRGTDQFNAIAYNNNSQFNAQARNNAAQTSANARLHAAQTRLGTDAGWYNSLYANIGNLFRGISDLGRENADRNQVARLVASGAIPGITPEHAMNAGWVKYADEPTVASKGGKLKRKKKMNLSI